MHFNPYPGVLLLACLLVAFTSCTPGDGDPSEDMISFEGKIVYQDLEGGFYGIVSDDGERYDPLNLPNVFQEDGKRVRVKGVPVTDQMSIRMWGQMLRVVEIEDAGP